MSVKFVPGDQGYVTSARGARKGLYELGGGKEVLGVDVSNALRLLDREGKIEITLPGGSLAEVEGVDSVLRQPA